MNSKSILPPLFISAFAGVLFTQCKSQTEESQNQVKTSAGAIAGAEVKNRATIEAKVMEKTPDYEVKEKGLDYLQSLPKPEIWLNFESPNNFKLHLPENVENILNFYWKDTLRLRRELDDLKGKGAENYKNKMKEILTLANRNKKLLEGEIIVAPNGKRVISAKEADEILRFVNFAAVGVIDKAKNI